MPFTFEGTVVDRTSRGVLFQGNYWDAPMWFPASQTTLVPDGDMTWVMQVKDWLAGKRGLLEFTYYNEEQIKAMGSI